MDMVHSDPEPSKVLTEQEKYKKAFQVAQRLAQHLSSVGMKEFEEGFQLLKTIKSKWDEGKKLSITDVDIDSGNECYTYEGTLNRLISYMLLLDGVDDAVIDDVEGTDSALDALIEAMEAVDGKCFGYHCYT